MLLVFDCFKQALHCKNMQKARELWDSIMTKGNAKYANMWLEYYNLERSVVLTSLCIRWDVFTSSDAQDAFWIILKLCWRTWAAGFTQLWGVHKILIKYSEIHVNLRKKVFIWGWKGSIFTSGLRFLDTVLLLQAVALSQDMIRYSKLTLSIVGEPLNIDRKSLRTLCFKDDIKPPLQNIWLQ